jgi:hypothetical protein
MAPSAAQNDDGAAEAGYHRGAAARRVTLKVDLRGTAAAFASLVASAGVRL